MEKIFLINERKEECVPQISLDAIAEFVNYEVPTDGVSDAYLSLQRLLNNANGAVFFPKGTYILSDSLVVDTSKVKLLQGNGAILKVTGDFPAIIVQGNPSSNNWTADPSSMSDKQKNDDSCTIISGLKITSDNMAEGTGIVLTNTWSAIVRNCHIYAINIGIEVRGRNRNIIIEGNNIYQNASYGLYYSEGSNCHQTNIVGNHISYCHICIYFKDTGQSANVQVVGNDIEISTYPSTDQENARCMVLDYSNTTLAALFSEFMFVGNTIQGHELSNGLIDFISAGTAHPVENVSISGNQISNVNGYAIRMVNCHNFAIGHNTYRHITNGAVLQLDGTVDCLAVSGETCEGASTFVGTSDGATLRTICLSGLNGKSLTKGINIDCATINGLVINGCNLTGGMTVAASTVDYVSVTGNISRGTNSIASCSHRVVENNI